MSRLWPWNVITRTVCLYITPSHYHCANFIWRHWTYKMPVRYNLSSVWVSLSIFSQLSIIQYVGLCVLSLPISFVVIERIYILCLIVIMKSEVWTIPLFRVRSWNNGVRCMSFYILRKGGLLAILARNKNYICYSFWHETGGWPRKYTDLRIFASLGKKQLFSSAYRIRSKNHSVELFTGAHEQCRIWFHTNSNSCLYNVEVPTCCLLTNVIFDQY